jgi:hypothetical protein
MKNISWRQIALTMNSLFMLMLGTPTQTLAENDYLKELNSEADELSTFNNGTSPKDENPSIEISPTDRVAFETRLKKELRNTFTIYLKLNEEQKKQVVESYVASGRKLPVASRQIFNLYFKVDQN